MASNPLMILRPHLFEAESTNRFGSNKKGLSRDFSLVADIVIDQRLPVPAIGAIMGEDVVGEPDRRPASCQRSRR